MRNVISLFVLSFAMLLLSCKPQVPSRYIQPDDFEDILFDWHLADAMANEGNEDDAKSYRTELYRQAVLKKHGVSQAQFDSSLVYYMRHADRLHKIYENISKRFSDNAMALGASANDLKRYGDMTSAKDTSNLWRGVTSCLLMSTAPYNVMSFDVEADSSYHKGDKIIFSFKCDFVCPEGSKDGVAVLAVQFKNDSIASTAIHTMSNINYSMTVSDNNNKGIKAIRGFIYLTAGRTEQNVSPLRMLFIDDIRMVKMRSTAVPQPKLQLQNNLSPERQAPDTQAIRRIRTAANAKPLLPKRSSENN